MEKGNPKALLPILFFVLFYLGLGILFEYILKVPMGFYNVPIVIAFLISILIASLQNKNDFNAQLEIMGQGLSDKNIITMIMIFLTAGIFVGIVGRGSAASVAYFILDLIPLKFAVIALFLISSFISIAMGTSTGTITLLTPIAINIAQAGGFSVPLCLATVMGGAMFGDNLSFISDTTIAACNGQGCNMRDKFHTNFFIAIPATIITLICIQLMANAGHIANFAPHNYNLLQIFPYILVLICGIAGMNVFLVLLLGIVVGSLIMLCTGAVEPRILLVNMGTGAAGMFETSMVAILVPALCALIKNSRGIDALLYHIRKFFKGQKSGKLGIGILVSAINIATANNTIAIVVANPIAKEMAEDYKISSKESAAILDTFSCIMQGIIPYGAQMLILLSVAASMGCFLNAFQIMQYLFYPYALFLCMLIYIFVGDKFIKKD